MTKLNLSRETVMSKLLDPRDNFKPAEIPCELRTDPLTGRTTRLAHFGTFPVKPRDFSSFDTAEQHQKCPFCPENLEKVTPRFPKDLIPEGRLALGQAMAIPNLAPYDLYSSLVIMTREHLLSLEAFDSKLLTDALLLAREVCLRVERHDPQAVRHLIGWNYMPPSGGSQLHCHLQVFSGTWGAEIYNREEAAAAEYFKDHGHNYWADLVAVERGAKERFLGGTGEVFWVSSFAPLGLTGDVEGFLPPGIGFHQLTEQHFRDVACGLIAVFRYWQKRGIQSFNLAFYPATGSFSSCRVRLTPRVTVHPLLGAPDVNVLQLLYGQSICVEWPEETASVLRAYFS